MAGIALLCALLGAPNAALAHERRALGGGKYDVVVGWENEPAYVNQRNAVGIRVSKAGTNPAEPVTGLEKTLKVQIRQGSQTRPFELHSAFGQPGYYVADLVPTRPGDYVWTFSGSIGTDSINETFDSADGKFDSVTASSDVEFPVAAPDPDQVRVQLQSAQATAQSAQTVAYIGTGIGIVGFLAAIAGWVARPRGGGGALNSRRAVGQRLS